MAREVTLSGGEIAMIKALGVSGSSVKGKTLIERLGELEGAEIVDTLQGLMAQDYVESDLGDIQRIDDVEKGTFKVSPAHVKEVRGALSPQRREREGRRQRRS